MQLSRPLALVVGVTVLGACAPTSRLVWPADVRAAAERGPEIRPPEGWGPEAASEAFHARGWFVLTESWIDDPSLGRVGHCWTGTTRTIGDAGGDVVPTDFSEHGLEGVEMGQARPLEGLVVYADDHTFSVCETVAGTREAVRDLAEECAAFGQAVLALERGVEEPAALVSLSMNAIELTLEIAWTARSLPVDRTVRELAGLSFAGVAPNRVGDPPTMTRVDDDWDVRVEMPGRAGERVALHAVTRMPRRPICGPMPLPPPAGSP